MNRALYDRQDVEMEMETEPVSSDNAENRSARQQGILSHKQAAPQIAPSSPPGQHPDLDPDNTTDLSSPEAEMSSSLPAQPYTPAATPPGTLSQESVDVPARLNIDERYIRLGIPGLYQRAFDLLNSRRISYTKSNKRVEVTLTRSQAYDIAEVFFSEMFCTTHKRVEAIVSNVEAYNIACHADAASVDNLAPEAIRAVFTSLSAIARRDRPEALDYLVQNVDNVRLPEAWEKVRASLAREDESSRQYINYLWLTPPTHGTTYVSLAKRALSRKAGISAAKFVTYLRNAQIPAALNRRFGLGSLLFCPNNMSGNRHRFRYPSAADEILGIIKSADTENLLSSWSKTLQHHIVQAVWDRSPLRLAIGSRGRGPTVGAYEHAPLLSCIYVLERHGGSAHVIEELEEE